MSVLDGFKHSLYNLKANAVRIMPEVIFQDADLCPILSVMLSQKACGVIPDKACALSFTAVCIVADRPVLKVRLQDRSGSMSMASCFFLLPAAARLYALSIF